MTVAKLQIGYRIKKLQEALANWGEPFVLIDNQVDLYYLTGLDVSAGSLLVGKNGAYFFVDSRYEEMAKKKVSHCDVRLIGKNWLKEVIGNNRLIIDSAATTVLRYDELKVECSLKPIPHLLCSLRSVKDPHELKLLHAAAQLNWKAFEYARKRLKVGITELEVAAIYEKKARSLGAEGLSFEPIIAFGKNSAMPHYRAGSNKLKKGDIVLMDLGATLNHYRSDMTRILFFGKPDPRLKTFYEIVREAHRAACGVCKAGATVGSLDKAARKVFSRYGVEPLFLHSLGHGVGLEIHEYPRIREGGRDSELKLESGMVITIEPGLYAPGIGGIRYEDTILVTEKGYKNFYPEKTK